MKEARVLQRKPEPRDLAMAFQRQGKEQKKHIILGLNMIYITFSYFIYLFIEECK